MHSEQGKILKLESFAKVVNEAVFILNKLRILLTKIIVDILNFGSSEPFVSSEINNRL